MNTQLVESAKAQGNLKHNFEAALIQLHEEDPKAVARHTPIAQRRSGTADSKTQALKVAAAALATLWGV